jgi:hypothetical protein
LFVKAHLSGDIVTGAQGHTQVYQTFVNAGRLEDLLMFTRDTRFRLQEFFHPLYAF